MTKSKPQSNKPRSGSPLFGDVQGKRAFCLSFPWRLVIRWLDLTGLHQLGDGRVASIELIQSNSEDYDRFHVKIISKTVGTIVSKTFLFRDYLDPAARSDKRADYPTTGPNAYRYHVTAHCGWKWYIAVPADTSPIVGAIEQYIAAYK